MLLVEQRDELQSALQARGIETGVHYPVPLHLQKCFQTLGYCPGSLPHTEKAAREVLSLPIFPELTVAEQATVVARLNEALQTPRSMAA